MATINTPVATRVDDSIAVWDPLVRIFHWSVVSFFFIAYLSEDELERIHEWAGYAVAMLVAFRLVWGFIGERHARFSDFVRGPSAASGYLAGLVRGNAPRYVGHNPAGGLMVVALLVSLAMTTLFGMILLGGDGAGPLAGMVPPAATGEWVEEVHEFFANATLALVVLHVAGVIVGSIAHRENLVKAMFTGRKPRH